MTRVQLVVTGECERRALHRALAQLFPADVEWPTPSLANSFTSTPITEPPASGVRDTLDAFANLLIGKVDETGDETLVIGVDDFEFQADARAVTKAVADALNRVLRDWGSSEARQRRLRAAVAARCSFHLLAPMVEAYFFAEPAALTRAGARRTSRFDPATCDVEAFEVVDAEFLAQPDSADKHDWCRGGARRGQHPKRYLKFLTSNGLPGNWSYRESRDGSAALETLSWRLVLDRPEYARWARAMINDIANFVGSEPVPGLLPEQTSLLLRNL